METGVSVVLSSNPVQIPIWGTTKTRKKFDPVLETLSNSSTSHTHTHIHPSPDTPKTFKTNWFHHRFIIKSRSSSRLTFISSLSLLVFSRGTLGTVVRKRKVWTPLASCGWTSQSPCDQTLFILIVPFVFVCWDCPTFLLRNRETKKKTTKKQQQEVETSVWNFCDNTKKLWIWSIVRGEYHIWKVSNGVWSVTCLSQSLCVRDLAVKGKNPVSVSSLVFRFRVV